MCFLCCAVLKYAGFSDHILFFLSVFLMQYGFNMVMSHAHAVNEIALSLNNKNSR